MVLYGSSFINLIFAFRGLAAALAHVGSHCVTGIALSPVDATFPLLSFPSLLWPLRESTTDERNPLKFCNGCVLKNLKAGVNHSLCEESRDHHRCHALVKNTAIDNLLHIHRVLEADLTTTEENCEQIRQVLPAMIRLFITFPRAVIFMHMVPLGGTFLVVFDQDVYSLDMLSCFPG
jgi:hypothetical protein